MRNLKVHYHELMPAQDDFYNDVLNGLKSKTKSIPPKYFYDQKGSQLFDEITETIEYYPTRTELKLLQMHALEISQKISNCKVLIEPGGANFSKVSCLLNVISPEAYVPIDISKEHLEDAVIKLSREFSELNIHAVSADFTKKLDLPIDLTQKNQLVFFPGSTIGNFHPQDALKFLETVAHMLGQAGYLLIGVATKNDIPTIERAYNDKQGFTAQFNLNLLARINRELSANFDLSKWQHEAFYNKKNSRIEMHLISLVQQTVHFQDEFISFNAGETIHTENSYKYSIEEFRSLVIQAGFTFEQVWQDDDQLFCLYLFSYAKK